MERYHPGVPILFREIQARCRDLTVNQWLAEFDSRRRSKDVFVGVWCNGNTTDFDSVVSSSSLDMPASLRILTATFNFFGIKEKMYPV